MSTNFTFSSRQGGNLWTSPSTQYLNGNYTGTNGNDDVSFGGGNGVVDTLGGHDTVEISGSGLYDVDLGAGNDKLTISGSGLVYADGGTGFDWFYVKSFGDHNLDGGANHDRISFSQLSGTGVHIEKTGANSGLARSRSDTGNLGADAVTFASMEYVYGSDFKDEFVGSNAADWFSSGDGSDRFEGRAGNDYFISTGGTNVATMGADDDVAYGGDGTDVFFGGNGKDRLHGGEGDDNLQGDDGDDYLSGGGGNDDIEAGAGADRVFGGSGDDMVVAVNGGVQDNGDDHFDGGAHEGYLSHDPVWGDMLTYVLSSGGVEINAETGKAHGLDASSAHLGTDSFVNFETYIGSQHNDRFIADHLERVKFEGKAGNDVVFSKIATLHLEGDEGIDTINFSHIDARVDVDLEEEVASIYNTTSGNKVATQQIIEFENVVGSTGNDTIIGNDDANRIEGGDGADILIGEGGADRFIFRGGDEYFYDRILDFQSGTDKLVLRDMQTTNGDAINDFDVLDSNGDGVLSNGDDAFYSWQGTGYLMSYSSIIELNNVSVLEENDVLIF